MAPGCAAFRIAGSLSRTELFCALADHFAVDLPETIAHILDNVDVGEDLVLVGCGDILSSWTTISHAGQWAGLETGDKTVAGDLPYR